MGYNPFKSIENKIKKGINSLGDEIRSGINHLGNEIKDGVRKVGRDVEGGVRKAAKEVEEEGKRGIRQVEGEARKSLEAAGKTIEAEAKQVLVTIEDEVKKAAQAAVDELAKAVTKEGLKTIRKVVKSTKRMLDSERGLEYSDTLDEIGVDVQLGPVTLAYANFYTRADLLTDSLDVWINKPPTFRRKPLLNLVEALAPDSVDFGVDFELALGVGSDAAGVGISLSSIPTKLFILIGDDILKELGVPE